MGVVSGVSYNKYLNDYRNYVIDDFHYTQLQFVPAES
jgi:hypothetical protein